MRKCSFSTFLPISIFEVTCIHSINATYFIKTDLVSFRILNDYNFNSIKLSLVTLFLDLTALYATKKTTTSSMSIMTD